MVRWVSFGQSKHENCKVITGLFVINGLRIGLSGTVVAAGVQERPILFFGVGHCQKGFIFGDVTREKSPDTKSRLLLNVERGNNLRYLTVFRQISFRRHTCS